MPASKKSSNSSVGGGASIARAVGRGSKNTTLREPLIKKKAIVKASELTTESTAFTKEQVALVEGREELDPNNPQYDALWNEVKAKMGMPKNVPSKCDVLV